MNIMNSSIIKLDMEVSYETQSVLRAHRPADPAGLPVRFHHLKDTTIFWF